MSSLPLVCRTPMVKLSLIFFLFAIQVGLVHASWFGPDNFEDCILESIPTAKTDAAVRLVQKTCRDKFPSESKNSKSLGLPIVGEYVCNGVSQREALHVISINEKAGTLKFDTGTRKILRSTKEKLYSEKWKTRAGNTVRWEFERVGACAFSPRKICATAYTPNNEYFYTCEESI